ncbi:NUDIX domain-containing protein [Candidatus Saccharibacteria bacterium]|nr:NUDIX domain-containing protein [Candidatus Saccharibacteria bacterium]
MPAVIVGGVLEKDNKYLLVQEAKEKCRGKWNLPAGHLEPNETIFEAAKREIKEESGLDAELSGVCQIGNRKLENDLFISVIFSTKVINDNIHFDPDEILDVRWFTYEEILSMKESLRNEHLILGSISNVRENLVAPISLVKMYD